MLKAEWGERGFQHLPRDLANVNALKKKILDCYYSINSMKYLLKFVEKYGTLFCNHLTVTV